MDLNPQRVRTAEFKTAKRGLDADEVRRFLGEVADALESAQNQSTAMEARARAAVARLQELSDDASTQATAARTDDVAAATAEQTETISRTLLLAQRTADTAIAQAEAESQRVVAAATEEAAATLDSTREMAAGLMEEARDEARRAGEAERLALASEVDSLKARRDFLESDVDHLDQFLGTQRERLRDAASAMVELTERVDGGLGEARRPLLSAADDEAEAMATEAVAAESRHESMEQDPSVDPAGTEDPPVDEQSAGGDAEAELFDEGVESVDVTPVEAPIETPIDDTEIGEFAVEDEASGVDPTPTSFALDDVTGDHDRPDAAGDVRFSFDDRR